MLCLFRLWVHEVMRVFYDRLIDDKDREWLFNEIRTIANTIFQESFDLIFSHLSETAVCNQGYFLEKYLLIKIFIIFHKY